LSVLRFTIVHYSYGFNPNKCDDEPSKRQGGRNGTMTNEICPRSSVTQIFRHFIYMRFCILLRLFITLMVSIQINVRRKPNKGNQEWTIQIHRQHCAQDTERRQTKKKQTCITFATILFLYRTGGCFLSSLTNKTFTGLDYKCVPRRVSF
jgi:hypothetical protein